MRNLFGCIGVFIVFTQALHGQQQTHYRDFQLGSSVSAISSLTSTPSSQIKIVHERPAVIQELEWRPRYFSSNGQPANDPVAVVTFDFYNDQLFRIVVDYDGHRTSGMTETDVIEAVATTYGPASKPTPGMNAIVSGRYGVPATAVAIWDNSEYVVTLLRAVYPEIFRLVLTHTPLDQLARIAAAEAARLDVEEAPQREIVQREREADEADAVREKSRTENKALFKP